MKNLKKEFQNRCRCTFGKEYLYCNAREQFQALSSCIMDQIAKSWIQSKERSAKGKQAYYFSSEYLMGRMLSNNLINLRQKDMVNNLLQELDIDYTDLEKEEPDAGLGNGGLGRLAACFLDSAATMNIPLQGYGLRYEYGIFKQDIRDGAQFELPDDWLSYGQAWAIERLDESVFVRFSDMEIQAVPYDVPIIGYRSDQINTLRLWSSRASAPFDLTAFNNQDYLLSTKKKSCAENITAVLYPNDSKDQGKILRIRQQYLLASASLQDMMRKHKQKKGRSPKEFHHYHVIQLNDTHPAISIAELMRLLTESESLSWSEAWQVVCQTFAYTNHTILAEALEKWPTKFYKRILPDIYQIIVKLNRQMKKELTQKRIAKEKQSRYLILDSNQIHMARLSIYGSFSVNGVAKLHTKILKEQELSDFYRLFPERFNNKTNGITPRRWILESNPELSEFITELLGGEEWITDLSLLKKLEVFVNDDSVMNRFRSIKQLRKNKLADYIEAHESILIDRTSIFDIQIKRLHEYKRQLLNALYIIDLYFRLKENPDLDILPRTFIFGAKAAPGYERAKGIIQYICEIQRKINSDSDTNKKLKVVFIKNYNVSNAQILFPAANISQQISMAGKEASGTGNMKFMLNGTPTIGTYDGANVEIVEQAGFENNFIFGLTIEEIASLQKNYHPEKFYRSVPGLKRALDTLVDGTFDDGGSGIFQELYDSILKGAHWHSPDMYYLMADFASYRKAQEDVDQSYRSPIDWARKCWKNLANAGIFSSDRTILEYNDEIWKL